LFPFSSIKEYQEALLSAKVTCVDAVTYYAAAIERKQHLNAYLEVYVADAMAQAALIDAKIAQKQPLGKLFGVIVGLKDVICYKNHVVSAASKILDRFTSIYNATAVEKLLTEDAIIIGRHNCDEFAMGSSNENSAFGAVKNALDETKVPGGSSGGSAVAVQAHLCMVALGSDTGGSVRQPADFCGVVGLKPTYGRISRYGLIAYASSFDQIGIFANNVTDAALVLEVIAGADNFDSTVSTKKVPSYSTLLATNKKFKFAYFKEALDHNGLDTEIATTIKKHIAHLQAQGHTVEPINFDMLNYVVPTYYILTTAEASSNLSRFDGVKFGYRAPLKPSDDLTELYKKTRSEGFGKEVQRRILLGTFVLSSGYFDAYFTKAQQVRRLLCNTTAEIFAQYDGIILPTVPTTAFTIGEKSDNQIEMFLADIYTVFANLVGIPAISIPLFKHSNGMPFGLQLMANHFEEVALQQMAATMLPS